MDDEIDDAIANGKYATDELAYWMSLSIPERAIAFEEYWQEVERWQEYLDESYGDWATR